MNNRTLSVRTVSTEAPQPGSVQSLDQVEQLCIRALRLRRCLSASYNRGNVVLEPVLLFREHDAAFLLARTALRDGLVPRESKLGSFRLSGLSQVGLAAIAVDRSLVPPEDWNLDAPRRVEVERLGLASPRMMRARLDHPEPTAQFPGPD
jgi:hypothetical protein